MGNKYVKEDETFNTSRNGVVPKPTRQDVTDGKVLGADGNWKNAGGSDVEYLGDLSDVNTSGASSGDVLTYNGQSWEPQEPAPGGVTDVEVDGQSVVDPLTGVASISMPSPPTIPVDDVRVNGTSVVDANKIAQVKSYKEVTQAQYEALPDTKLNDGILYAIKDGGEAIEGFPPLIYSLQEREVGVWTDGKPLYQKSYEFSGKSISANSQTSILSNLTGITVVSMHGYMHEGNNRFELGEAGLRLKLDTSTNILLIESKSGSSWSNIYGIVTLWYTKNSESAGSGTWNQQGAIAHHYSTDEKVIGTWINGKPLYEKTIILETSVDLIDNQWTNVVQFSNIDTLVNGTGYRKYSGQSNVFQFLFGYNNGYIRIWTPVYYTVDIFTLQYTKITD